MAKFITGFSPDYYTLVRI